MKLAQLEQDIADMESVYNDADTPANIKESIAPALKKARQQLADMDKGSKAAPKPKHVVKAAATKSHNVTAHKKTSGAKVSFKKAMELSKKYRKEQGLSTKKADIERDATRSGKPAGKRVSAEGNTYYENRENRSDRVTRKYPKLEKGGNVVYTKKWKVIYITTQGTKGEKIITLGRMSDKEDVKQAIKRMAGPSGVGNIREVVSITEMHEDGGKVNEIPYVAVSETKDGMWVIASRPTSKEKAEIMVSVGVSARGETGKVVTLEEARAHKNVLGKEYLYEDGGMLGDATGDFRFDITSPAFELGGNLDGVSVGNKYNHINWGEVTVTKIEPNEGDKADRIPYIVYFVDSNNKEEAQGIGGFKYSVGLQPAFAKGGMIAHGFHSGDVIYEIYKGYGIIDVPENHNHLGASGNTIVVINPNTGNRYVVDHKTTNFKQGIDKARNYIDDFIKSGDEKVEETEYEKAFGQNYHGDAKIKYEQGGKTTAKTYDGIGGLTRYQKQNTLYTGIHIHKAPNGTNIELVPMHDSTSSTGMTYAITINGRGIWATNDRAAAKEFYEEEIKKYHQKYEQGGKTSGQEKFEKDIKNVKDQINMVQLQDGTLIRGSELKFAKGGKMRTLSEYNALWEKERKSVAQMSNSQVAKSWNENTGELTTKWTVSDVDFNPEYFKSSLVQLLVEKQLTEEEYNKYFAKGGVTFADKVNAIAKKLSGTKVAAKYKKKYGSKYSPKEAKEAASNIVGAMVSKTEKGAKKVGRKAKNLLSRKAKALKGKYVTKK